MLERKEVERKSGEGGCGSCLDKQVCGAALSKIYFLRVSSGEPDRDFSLQRLNVENFKHESICKRSRRRTLKTLKTFDCAQGLVELKGRLCGRQSLIKSGLVGHGFDWQTPVLGALSLSLSPPLPSPTYSSTSQPICLCCVQSLLFFGFALICICGKATTSRQLASLVLSENSP